MALLCDASGHPNPTVSWSKHGDQGFVNRNGWLNFTKIRRVEAGNYACHANNTCGKNSSVRTVDVQCKKFSLLEKKNSFTFVQSNAEVILTEKRDWY